MATMIYKLIAAKGDVHDYMMECNDCPIFFDTPQCENCIVWKKIMSICIDMADICGCRDDQMKYLLTR